MPAMLRAKLFPSPVEKRQKKRMLRYMQRQCKYDRSGYPAIMTYAVATTNSPAMHTSTGRKEMLQHDRSAEMNAQIQFAPQYLWCRRTTAQ